MAIFSIFLQLLLRRLFSVRCIIGILTVWLGLMPLGLPALAAAKDPYVIRYLRVVEPIAVKMDDRALTRLFSPADLSAGKQLFENNCMSCHVGGATLPNPPVSLSLTALEGANPPRDDISHLVAYLRRPMTYDGSEESYWCRQVPESWMPSAQVENLAAFVLTAAQRAPGWGTDQF